MKLETFRYQKDKGWSVPSFPIMDSPQTLVLIFGAPEFQDQNEEITKLVQAYPNSIIAGCSSSGEIFNEEVSDHSLSVAVIAFEHTKIKLSAAEINNPEKSFEVGKKLASEINLPDLSGAIIFSDGLKVNGSALVQGITSILPPGINLTGGLAGDGADFKKTWVIHRGAPQSGIVTLIAFYGKKIQLSHGSQGGWDIFGPERIVTKSKDNVLFELDGKPALQLYKEYLGEKASELPASALLFPLQIRATRDETYRVVRTILAIDEKTQGMTFAGNVPQGYYAQLMRANFDRLIGGAAAAANHTISKKTNASGPTLIVAISCVGRRLVLGERTEEEVEATLQKFPKGAKQIGFYSYGEISPHVEGTACELHNQTMTLTTISEE